MKIAKRLIPVLLVILVITGIACSHADKTEVEKVIISELDLLKNLDSETTHKYISYKELFPDATEDTELSDDIKEVFSLFFQNFDYKILDIDVDNEKKTAVATLRLFTMDAQTLAKDFALSQLESEILTAANADSQSTEEILISLEDRYLILNQLLKNNKYESVENSCTMQLHNAGDSDETWEIDRTHTLENDLVGGLMTYLSDNAILSPEETLTVYLNTFKTMDLEQMNNYLGADSILNTSDSDKNSIASALTEQVRTFFDCEIKECTIDGYTATVETEITTFDSDSIHAAYHDKFTPYLETPEAVIDGSEKRHEKSLNLLLECIESNTAVKKVPATFVLINDGAAWKLSENGAEFGNAIFGTLSTSLFKETTDDTSVE